MFEIDYELKILKSSIMEMTNLVETAIKDAVSSLLNNDNELGRKVIRNDHIINSYNLWIDDYCIKLISEKQPYGKNLKFITTAMKLSSDLEHIADSAVKIAERDIDIDNKHSIESQARKDILKICETVISILRDTVQSFIKEENLIAINAVIRYENADNLHDKFIEGLMVDMCKSSDPIYCMARISYAARHLEKMGKHSAKLAEMVVNMIEGHRIKQTYTEAFI